MKRNLLSSTLILFFLQGFFSKFLEYSSLTFLLFYIYNIFAAYFPSNFPFLKSCSSTISNFSYFLTSAPILPSNSTTTFFTFSKSISFSYILRSVINPFYCTKYFITPLNLIFSLPSIL